MSARTLCRFQVLVLLASVTLLACGGDEGPTGPGAETLASLAVTPLGIVEPGQPVDLLVEGVGSEGTRPFPADGTISLAADRGTVTPDALGLTAGTARGTVQLSATDSTVVLTASLDAATGSASVNLSPIAILPGDPGAPVEGAIPVVDFTPRPGDYRTGHADFPELRISYNTLTVIFALGTTVGEANAILTPLQPTIVGGFPGAVGSVPGILDLRVPSLDHETMAAMIARLDADPRVELALEDEAHDPDLQPTDGSGIHSNWVWRTTPSGGNWGLELCRVPALWNFNPAIEKANTGNVSLGMVDSGQHSHPDLSVTRLNSGFEGTHGTHVAGTMVATFDNGVGMEGIHPYATLRTVADTTFSDAWERTAVRKILDAAPDTRVINISIGIKWKKLGINPGNDAGAQRRSDRRGREAQTFLLQEQSKGREPILCVSAGNDSDDPALGRVETVYNSSWANAGLAHGMDQVLPIENVKLVSGGTATTRAADSNINGFLSAPGTAVLSTWSGGDYRQISGTSMASPFVAGVIGYLVALEPSLTIAEIRRILFTTAEPAGDQASDRIDAFGAALQIDAERGTDAIVRRLLDIDDGTVDGNRRVAFDSSIDYTEEDADNDGGAGDGAIDMSDFRRWRDWFLYCADPSGLSLDGTPGHDKKDVNASGFVELPAQENVWPRGDFNGDGVISDTDTRAVPGYFNGEEKTDLEMLQEFFADPDVAAGDLPGLVESADLHVDLSDFLGRLGSVSARVRVLDGITEALITERTFSAVDPDPPVITVASDLSLYLVRIEGLDGAGQVVCTDEDAFPLAPGEDVYLTPSCSNVVVEITAPAEAEPGVPAPLLVRAGRIEAGGTTYGSGILIDLTATGAQVAPATGTTDADGYVTSEVTLDPGTEVATVFATATDPGTGSSDTGTAEIRRLLPPAKARFHSDALVLTASCAAGPNPGGEEYSDRVLQFDVPILHTELQFDAEGTCPEVPGPKATASVFSDLGFDLLEDGATGYLRGFDFSGQILATGETPGDTEECGLFGAAANGMAQVELVVEVLDEPAVLDLDFDFSFSMTNGVGAEVRVWEGEPPSSWGTSVFNESFQGHTAGSSTRTISGSIDLTPGEHYYIKISVQAGEAYSWFDPTMFDHSMQTDGRVRIRKP